MKKTQGFGTNRRYFLSSVDPEQYCSPSPTHDTHVTKAQAQRISHLRPQPSLKLLEKAVAKAKPLTPDNFAKIPNESGLYLLHATGSPRGLLYYVGISQNLYARLCPIVMVVITTTVTQTRHSIAAVIYVCGITHKNMELIPYITLYLKIFDKSLTPQEIADIETAWIQIYRRGKGLMQQIHQ